jgi:hypothetical protein
MDRDIQKRTGLTWDKINKEGLPLTDALQKVSLVILLIFCL